MLLLQVVQNVGKGLKRNWKPPPSRVIILMQKLFLAHVKFVTCANLEQKSSKLHTWIWSKGITHLLRRCGGRKLRGCCISNKHFIYKCRDSDSFVENSSKNTGDASSTRKQSQRPKVVRLVSSASLNSLSTLFQHQFSKTSQLYSSPTTVT